MLLCETYMLVTCLISFGTAIRVYWNTNKGPIVPATPRPTAHFGPPYREPAPVWENQSDDIPNPNLYNYILPSPSRSRSGLNIFSPEISTNYNSNYYGGIISPSEEIPFVQGRDSQFVTGLSAKHIPNVGIKYFPVVRNNAGNSVPGPPTNAPSNDYNHDKSEKIQGRFNAKTKRYKAYEKVKYLSRNYQPLFDSARPGEQYYVPQLDPAQLVRTQQLPSQLIPQPFRMTRTEAQSSLRPQQEHVRQKEHRQKGLP